MNKSTPTISNEITVESNILSSKKTLTNNEGKPRTPHQMKNPLWYFILLHL